MTEDVKARALVAALRVAARHPHLLDEEAFSDLAEAVAPIASGGRLSVLVPEEGLAMRVYAMGPGPNEFVGFGGIVHGTEPEWSTIFRQGVAVTRDDMREGGELDRAAAAASPSTRSYVAAPCRVTAPRPKSMAARSGARLPQAASVGSRVVAMLTLTFPTVGGQKRVPLDAFQELADALGPAIERATFLSRERRLATILETSRDAMLAWDRDGRVADANTAAEAIVGRGARDMIGVPIAELLQPPPEPAGVPVEAGTRLTLFARDKRTGEPRSVTVAATVAPVEHDAVVAAHALLRDLTSVVAAERAAAAHLARIHELEEQHRTLLDNAPVIIFRLDPRTRELVYLNHHAERLLGVPVAEALATKGFLRREHADADGAAAFDAAVDRAAAGGSTAGASVYEARLARRGGEAISVRGSVYPQLTDRGEVAAIEGVLADVSAEQAARARLVQADRLSTLGTLAAGVAHEINNPAAFILLGIDLLARQLGAAGSGVPAAVAASAEDTLRELRASIRRIVDIARDLRLFASAPAVDPGRRALVDVRGAVESALSLTRGQILERAELEQHLDEVPPVLMDEGRLGQVMVNLLVNAAQAIPAAQAGDRRIVVATRSDGPTVEIEVRDTGVGIPAENLARIWEPFFTTKGPDAGTGLGLSISREIVERAGGTITAESPPRGAGAEAGTRFVIRLPEASAGEAVRPSASAPPQAARRARVLVVEDEGALARALAEEIGAQHEVVIAGGAEAALERLAEGPFDVVLCDLRMPGMSGEALYARVRASDPQQADRFVFMTGVGFGAELTRFLADSGRVVLEKPFPASRALEAIARIVRAAGRRA
jgi:PAS domain S-box-containing protein